MTVFLFDMDATLTPPRLPMTETVSARFLLWQFLHTSYIATGSDFKKVKEQLPASVIDAFTGIYCSMGNVLTVRGCEIYRKDFIPPSPLIADLEDFVRETKYPGKLFPNHIERRVGMVNFSVLGRSCPYEARKEYSAWDKKSHERISIQKALEEKYPELEISVGGEISIDITPHGGGKGQIAHRIRESYPTEEIIFIGDRTEPGGNDYALASELMKYENTRVIQVTGPDEVLEFLGI